MFSLALISLSKIDPQLGPDLAIVEGFTFNDVCQGYGTCGSRTHNWYTTFYSCVVHLHTPTDRSFLSYYAEVPYVALGTLIYTLIWYP